MTSINKLGNNLKVLDNEGFYDPNQKGEFKGIFHGVDVEKKYYEAGAHFSYSDLCRRLMKVQKSRDFITQSSEMKPGGGVSIANEMSRNQLGHMTKNMNKASSQYMTIDPNQTKSNPYANAYAAYGYSKDFILNNKETEKRSVSKEIHLQQHYKNDSQVKSKTRNNNFPFLNVSSSKLNPHQPSNEKKIYTTINNNPSMSNHAHSRNNSALRDIEKVKQRIISMDFSNYNHLRKNDKFPLNSKLTSHHKVKSIEFSSFNEHKAKEQHKEINAHPSHLVENKVAYQTFKFPVTEQVKEKKLNEPSTKLQKIDHKISSLISKLNTIIPKEGEQKTLRVKTASMENIFTKPQLKAHQPIKVNLNTNIKGGGNSSTVKEASINSNHYLFDSKNLNKSKDKYKQLSTIQVSTKSRNATGSGINRIGSLNKNIQQSKSYLYNTQMKTNLNYQTINNNHLNRLQNDNTTTERKNVVVNKPNLKQVVTTKDRSLLKNYSGLHIMNKDKTNKTIHDKSSTGGITERILLGKSKK